MFCGMHSYILRDIYLNQCLTGFYTIDYFKKIEDSTSYKDTSRETLGTVPSKQSVYDEIIKKYNQYQRIYL